MDIGLFDADSCEPHAIVREEDVQLILSAAAELRPVPETFARIERMALEARRHEPGSVVVRAGRPLSMLAIIHDVDREPSCCEEWILAATRAVFREAQWRGLTTIAMPPLGTVHGGLAPEQGIELLATVLGEPGTAHPGTLLLQGVGAELLRSRALLQYQGQREP